ncbi:ATP-binding cassette domain-containing protein [Actinocorallia populi]|uniref:ATP-binding cassette domain-containing protein n=1 Tax=Actinocorallia populi TaxID=2079200 RepID=UPI000D09615C|nr:ABC transporter ATP-binding protein [Actinocorallia populi]
MRRRPLPVIVWRALRQEPGRLRRILAWSVLESAPAFFLGYAVARAVDLFAEGRPAGGLAWLALLALVWTGAAVAAGRVVLAVAEVVEPFRDRLLAHVVRHGLAGGRPADAPAARANQQVELARDSLASVVTVLRSFVFTVASVVLGLLALMPQIALLVLPPFLLGLCCFLCSLPALARRQRAFLRADERTTGAVTGLAGGLRDIAACGAEERLAGQVCGIVAEQARAGRALARVTALRTVALALGGLLPALVLLAGTPWLLGRGASAGAVVGALAYVTQSLAPALGGLVEGLGMSGVRLAAVLDLLLLAPPPRRDLRPPRPGRPQVELRRVSFAYGPRAAPVLRGLSLALDGDDHLAVVGPSGIGKSTLAGLVCGLLAPDTGEVLVRGVPAPLLDPAARTLIPQEAYVFQGTLRENLSFHAAASDAALWRAADAVGLTGLAERLGGLSARVDPALLSAGERQLIALTRAYLAPAGPTVLDEATCHLDPAAEARAERAFMERGGVLLVVAHRVSSAKRAARVLFMDGRTIALGPHAELLDSFPHYAELFGSEPPVNPVRLVEGKA